MTCRGAVLVVLLAAGAARAADDPGDPAAGVLEVAGPVTGTMYSGRGTVLVIPLRLKTGWHVQANPASEGMIATEVLPIKCGPVKFGRVTYPAGRPFSLAGSPEVLSVYEGVFEIRVAVAAPPMVKTNAWQGLDFAVRYQPCDATACYPPRVLDVRVKVNVLAPKVSARR